MFWNKAPTTPYKTTQESLLELVKIMRKLTKKVGEIEERLVKLEGKK